jgi:hypothetical protein
MYDERRAIHRQDVADDADVQDAAALVPGNDVTG